MTAELATVGAELSSGIAELSTLTAELSALAAAFPTATAELPTGAVALQSDLVTTAADVGLILVGLLCLLCGYRVIVGPTVPDRVVALDAIATNVVAIAVLFALKTGRGLFVTVSLVLAIIGFLSTVSVAKYVTEGDVIERRELARVDEPVREADPVGQQAAEEPDAGDGTGDDGGGA